MDGPNDDGSYFRTFNEMLEFTYGDTPCKVFPHTCLPKKIDAVIWDADDTLWDIKPIGLASFCQPPYEKVGDDAVKCTVLMDVWRKKGKKQGGLREVQVAREQTVRLKSSVIETLDKLASMGIKCHVASNNEPGKVEGIITALGIRDKFDIIQSDFDSKPYLIDLLLKKTRDDPTHLLFIDDERHNVSRVYFDLGITSLCMGVDIQAPAEVLDFIMEV